MIVTVLVPVSPLTTRPKSRSSPAVTEIGSISEIEASPDAVSEAWAKA